VSAPDRSLGQVAFDAYREHRMGLTHDGKLIPEWAELGQDIRNAWVEAVDAVMIEVGS